MTYLLIALAAAKSVSLLWAILRIVDWAIYRFVPGMGKLTFRTHTNGRHWWHGDERLQASRLTDELHSFYGRETEEAVK